jgi:LemA protein
MKALVIVLVILAVVVGGFFMWFVGVGNRIVATEQAVNAAWAQVQTTYQRRADLIPNLVETVRGFAAQERTVLEEVTRARSPRRC